MVGGMACNPSYWLRRRNTIRIYVAILSSGYLDVV
jgi:hypothetical protein